MITLEKIKDAHKKILPYVNYTPLVHSEYLSNYSNVKLKLENFQITGSFKLRGALNKLLSLSKSEKEKGVIAVSTGNHGKGVAYASKVLGIKSTIYMSSMVPQYRRKAIENLGAKVEIVGQNSDEADLFAKNLAKEKNISLIHPFDDEDIIIGQGTVGLEMLEQFPDADTIIIPTSGGGLVSGIAQAIKLQKPKIKIISVSMERGPSMYDSLKKGVPVDVEELETLADCLGGSIGLDNKFTFNIVKEYVDDFVLVSEEKIAEGIKINFLEHKIVSEGAAATSIMVVKEKLSSHIGKNIICLICGGNIDAQLFNKVLSSANT
ncbi:threonine/serine dehydratase [Pelagibacteraceae bacterium]|nr:threonine/serine dehydratase [Pelagibacteraceae bacterium]